MLKEVCCLAKKMIHEYDIITRCGDDEFATVLNETTEETVRSIAEKIRSELEIFNINVDKELLNVTTSFDVTEIMPHKDNYKKDHLINFADQALLES